MENIVRVTTGKSDAQKKNYSHAILPKNESLVLKYAQRKSSKYSSCYLESQYLCDLWKAIVFTVSLIFLDADEFVHTSCTIMHSIMSQVCRILNFNWIASIIFCQEYTIF